MVVLSGEQLTICDITYKLSQTSDCVENLSLEQIFLDICQECARMAAIPQGAFAACKLRSQKKTDLTVSKCKFAEKPETKKYDSKKLMDYSPVKYNSKLMKSIWGFYNRYSPHNIKGNNDDGCQEQIQVQQPIAVASSVIAENLVMTIRSGNEWVFPFPGKPAC